MTMKQLPVVLSQLFCGCCDPESHAALRDRRTAASRAYHGPGHARTLMKRRGEESGAKRGFRRASVYRQSSVYIYAEIIASNHYQL
eukprot:COSAG01_NODE_24575_length_774_cov_1.014815_2_plen_85_part_01